MEFLRLASTIVLSLVHVMISNILKPRQQSNISYRLKRDNIAKYQLSIVPYFGMSIFLGIIHIRRPKRHNLSKYLHSQVYEFAV